MTHIPTLVGINLAYYMAAFLSLDDPRMLALRARADWRCVGLYMGLMHLLASSKYRLLLSPHVLTGLSYQLRISESELTELLELLAELNIVVLKDGEVIAPDQIEEQERKRAAAEKRWNNKKQESAKQSETAAMQEPVFFVQSQNPALQAEQPALQDNSIAMQSQNPALQAEQPALQAEQPALQPQSAKLLHLSPPHPPYPENSLSPPPSLPLDGGRKFLPPTRETVIGRFVAAGLSADKAEQEADVYLSDRQRRHWEVQPGRDPSEWDWEADVRNWIARDRNRSRHQKGKHGGKSVTATPSSTEPKPKKRLADLNQ